MQMNKKHNIIELFIENCNSFPHKNAIIFEEEILSYVMLAERVKVASEQFCSIGIKKDSKILLLLPNSIEFVVSMLAAADIGAVIVPLSLTLSENAISTACKSSDAEFLIADTSVIKKLPLDDILKKHIIIYTKNSQESYDEYVLWNNSKLSNSKYRLGQNNVLNTDDFILTMTSGSTGVPKPIVFSQETKIRRGLDACAKLYNLDDRDVVIAASPLYHSLGQRLALFPLLIGATTVILKKFTPALWLQTVEKHKVTFTIAVSSHLDVILKAMHKKCCDISSLKTIVSSSSLLKNAIKKECITRLGCSFHECYGASEVGIVTNLYPEDTGTKLQSVGIALPFVDMKIVDNNGTELSVGKIGEIICKTTTAFSRYFKLPVKTAESVINDYFYTGDLGRVDNEGYLYFCGRKKELIIVGGTNVYPADVESVISSCENVKECAVIGVDDEYFGEAILAVMVLKDKNAPLTPIRRCCEKELADYQRPMAYEIVDELPKNALGKLMKHKLKDIYKGYDATAKIRAMLSR